MSNQILIVDDDPGILEALAYILEDEGYTVITEKKSEQVLSDVKKYNPAVLLLDVLMSGHDGRKICSRLKQHTSTKHVPVILISAHPTAGDAVAECGADGFLPKPFDIDLLLETISKYTTV
ncbi:response regulator [Candidatus Roizmanbacteria bacterium]|nr:response regulator [Candidatus Roizmanbacteria bacterium]